MITMMSVMMQIMKEEISVTMTTVISTLDESPFMKYLILMPKPQYK